MLFHSPYDPSRSGLFSRKCHPQQEIVASGRSERLLPLPSPLLGASLVRADELGVDANLGYCLRLAEHPTGEREAPKAEIDVVLQDSVPCSKNLERVRKVAEPALELRELKPDAALLAEVRGGAPELDEPNSLTADLLGVDPRVSEPPYAVGDANSL